MITRILVNFILLLSLSLLLAAPPPRARPLPTPCWILTCIRKGALTTTGYNTNSNAQYNESKPWATIAPFQKPRRFKFVPGDVMDIQSAGSLTIVAKWLNPDGTPGAHPPSRLSIKVESSALWELHINQPNVTNHSADDGFPSRDPETMSSGSGWVQDISQGTHLIQLDGSSGQASFPLSINTEVAFQSGNYSGFGLMEISLCLSVDNRPVTINSSQGRTYKRVLIRGVATLVIDKTDKNMNTFVDTLWDTDMNPFSPDYGEELAGYKADPTGDWSPNGAYNWYADGGSVKNTLNPGLFSLPSNLIPKMTGEWQGLDPRSNSPKTFYEDIHLTDPKDNADVYGFCFTTFHSEFEDWVVNPAGVKYSPRSVPPFSPWKYVTSKKNNSRIPISWTVSNSITAQNSPISFSGGIATNIKIPDEETKAFQQSLRAYFSYLRTFPPLKLTSTITFTIPAGTKMYIYAAPSSVTETGTCSHWGREGYIGEVHWWATIRGMAPTYYFKPGK